MRSQLSAQILDWLESNPASTEPDIQAALGLSRNAVYQAVRRLREHDLVHISGYEVRKRTGSGFTRQYTAGKALDAHKPHVPEREQKRRKIERGIKRKREVRIMQAAKHGPIAYMAAVSAKPRKAKGSKYGPISY